MRTKKPRGVPSIEGSEARGDGQTLEHKPTGLHRKSAGEVQRQIAPLSKTDSRYWLRPGKLKKGNRSANYSMQVQFKGQRMAFSTGTGNRDAAARIAAKICTDIVMLGVDVALVKHRTQKSKQETEIATVGEWIEAAKKVFAGKPSTFSGYARSLRYIAADISSVQRQRHSRRKVLGYRLKVDAESLEILTPEALQEWRIAFVERAKGNPAKQKSARISSNSFIRLARSLFTSKIRKFVSSLVLPEPAPFAGVEFFPRESMRYHSKIDPGEILRAAAKELAPEAPEAFKALILALGAGMRRGEIDRLLWRQVNCKTGEIHLETTEVGDLKSSDSAGIVAIDEALCTLLAGFQKKARQQYVIEADAESSATSKEWGNRYRCSVVFERLNFWLRANGVKANKPLHTLRKEAGSIIATQSGIYAASRFLRHADIGVTAAHYADHKEKVTVGIGGMLNPSEGPNRNSKKN